MGDVPLPVARLAGVSHHYDKVLALDNVSLDLPRGCIVGLIGPDGVGKSTVLGLIAGARRIQQGNIHVLDGDMSDDSHRGAVQPRIAYMPQGLGRNLYMDLSVVENIEFFGRLFGQARVERRERIALLMKSTGLGPFADRAAGKLSGGMKQKLGLCCALIHDPDLLILDEPTTGVDPLSRRQFWDLLQRLRRARPEMSVIVATAYMEEAERFDWLVAMNEGKVLTTGTPANIRENTATTTLEQAFIALLPESRRRNHVTPRLPPRIRADGEPAIMANRLTRRFGSFTAVDAVSFRIERGEIFGFLGSNGSGKTTTMKVLTGLLPATEGEARLFGQPIRPGDGEVRGRIGYMSQSFSLYEELTVRQNLKLHGRLFQMPEAALESRARELMGRFGLEEYADRLAEKLSLGVRQRLSLAVAIIHDPEILILDEPTSGVDPIARDRFWDLLIDLSRNRGVTIFISTHFLDEGARCDRVSFMHAGKVLATGSPVELMASYKTPSLEDAFIVTIENAIGETEEESGALPAVPARPIAPSPSRASLQRSFSLQRLWTFSLREAVELWRDPIRLTFAFFGTAILMLVFGYGITFDVENLKYATLDWDNTPESRSYVEAFRGSLYFQERPPIHNEAERELRLRHGDIVLAIEIPPGFGRDLRSSRTPEVAVWIDGSMPFRAETIHGYVEGIHLSYLANIARRSSGSIPVWTDINIEPRFLYNQSFSSVFAIVPATIALMLMFIPAILTALCVVREKELGSITNLYVTPATRFEFLAGKQLPYIAIGMVNFFVMVALAVLLFGVPIKGDAITLTIGAALYLLSTTAIGLVISTFTRSQIAALFGTAIATMIPAVLFSGMIQPVSSLGGTAQFIGQMYPTSHFLLISVGVFTKGLGFMDFQGDILALLISGPALTALAVALLRKQER